MTEVVVTVAAIRRAKLHSNYQHQRAIIQHFYRPDVLPVSNASATRSSADADNALDANEAGIRVIRGVPNFRKSIT